MNFYIADLHFGHKNILALDNRPFSDSEEMQRILIENWNRVVTRGDTVYVLGDFCWEKPDKWRELLTTLNGQKVLILGNHDLKRYTPELRPLFQDVTHYKEISDNGRHVILSHYPIPFHKKAYDPNWYMLYGHVHVTREEEFLRRWQEEIRASRQNSGDARGNFVNVGCMMPYMGYTPRTLDEILTGSGLTDGASR